MDMDAAAAAVQALAAADSAGPAGPDPFASQPQPGLGEPLGDVLAPTAACSAFDAAVHEDQEMLDQAHASIAADLQLADCLDDEAANDLFIAEDHGDDGAYFWEEDELAFQGRSTRRRRGAEYARSAIAADQLELLHDGLAGDAAYDLAQVQSTHE